MIPRARTHILAWTCLVLILAGAAACRQDGRDQEAGYLEGARKAFASGYYLEAEKGYEEYLQKHPQGRYRLEAWNRLLDIAVNVRDDPDKGIALTEAMLLEFGNDPDISWRLQLKLGELYELMGHKEKAMETRLRCLDSRDVPPDVMVEVRVRIAESYRRQGNYDFAQSMLLDCVEEAPTSASRSACMYELALIYSFQRNWTQSREVLEEVMRMADAPLETHALAAFLLADIYEHERRPDKARELLESIKDTYPNPKAVQARLLKLQ